MAMKQGVVRALLLAATFALATAAVAQVRIGVTVSATGPAASLGIPEKNTIALCPKIIAGSNVEYIVLDDATDTTTAVQRMPRKPSVAARGSSVKRSGRTCLGLSSFSPLGLRLFQKRGQIVQPFSPEASVMVDPVRGDPQRRGPQPAHAPLRVDASFDQASALEHPQVARHRRQRDVERLGEIADCSLAACEPRQYRAPRRIGERGESLVQVRG